MIKQIFFVGLLAIQALVATGQNKYALLVGINDYYEVRGVKSEVSLHGSVNDANSIRELLMTKFGFNSRNIDTIYNGAATRDNIIAGLQKKLKQCHPGDAMVFYYSGHGVYLFNKQEDKDSIKGGLNQAMLTSDLYNYNDHLKCLLRDFTLKQYFNLFVDKKIILTTIFDCCFSGNLSMAVRGRDPSEKTKSVDFQALIGRLTANADNSQILIDSITGMKTAAPTGCALDANGAIIDRSDADGDGVPDCKDQEKFTNKECLPVDSNGIGNCSFEFTQEAFHKTLNQFDSSELRKTNAQASEKAFSASAVETISEIDTIRRPVERKNSNYVFISATTDREKAVEFNDEKGVRRSFFTAAMIRVYNKNPSGISVQTLYQKIVEDMASYHRSQSQTPTLYSDPKRKSNNLLGIKIKAVNPTQH